MKLLFLTIATLLTFQSEAQQPNRFRDLETIDTYFQYKPNKKRPLVLAHRGGPSASDTENSISTFEKVATALPDAIIEMDVRMTRDSGLVLLHDATLDRESDAKGEVSNWTLTNLKSIQLKTLSGQQTNQPIPTFDDVLAWNRNRYMLALDVKPGTDPLYVLKMVEKQQALHSVFVICYSVFEAQRVRNRYPTLWLAVGINSMSDLERIEHNTLVKTGRLIALTPQKMQPVTFYARLHKLGIPSSIGTYGAGQLDEQPIQKAASGYRMLFTQGADIITTDRPLDVAKLF